MQPLWGGRLPAFAGPLTGVEAPCASGQSALRGPSPRPGFRQTADGPSEERLQPGLRPAKDQRVHVMRPLIGIHGF